ncbi:MAG: hypothetical protein JRG72_04640 [Deltaproteobacteria bacterium]|nr:hypothetical protein [Deltaproteobacteria bacterium]MBW2134509.1 hypothetical protein [Deltaproteobacteria bacterium]
MIRGLEENNGEKLKERLVLAIAGLVEALNQGRSKFPEQALKGLKPLACLLLSTSDVWGTIDIPADNP